MEESCKDRVETVLEDIRKAAVASGRKPSEITLMGVSKTHPWESVLQGYEAGLRVFGENRVQEVQSKFPVSSERPSDMDLHLIGHLQSNKVKKIVPLADGIDSIDSLKVASLVNDCCLASGRSMPVLLEFNTSEEEAKSGFENEADFFHALDQILLLPGLSVQGLMTVGPLGGDEKQVRNAFSRLRGLREDCRIRYPHISFDTLSMGMSGDYIWAIEEGSTMVRVGTRLFGMRDYST